MRSIIMKEKEKMKTEDIVEPKEDELDKIRRRK